MFKQTAKTNELKAQAGKQAEFKTLSLRTALQAGKQPDCDNCYNYCRDKGYSHQYCRYSICPDYCSSSEHP